VGSHAAAIGLPADDRFNEAIMGLMSRASQLGSSANGRVEVYAYQDPSGSRATVTLEERRVVCFTPSFAPATELAVQVGELADDECPFERPVMVEVIDANGEEAHPLAVAIEDLGAHDGPPLQGDGRLEAVGLAEQVTLFADEAAYRASGTPMAVASLIPSGLFAPGIVEPERGEEMRITPRMLMSGTVLDAELRRHTIFDVPFVVCRVASYASSWTVCLDIADLGGPEAPRVPEAGSILSGSFYVAGRFLAVPAPA
jgi:hypothetical protein